MRAALRNSTALHGLGAACLSGACLGAAWLRGVRTVLVWTALVGGAAHLAAGAPAALQRAEPAAAASKPGQELWPGRKDVVELLLPSGARRLEGRLLCATDPALLWFETDKGIQRLERAGLRSLAIDSRRTRLADWMALRRPGLSAEQAFDLVAAAELRGLSAMARLQAMAVLRIEPEHAGAHRFLGHGQERRSGRFLWPLRKGPALPTPAFLEWTQQNWEQRLVLASEHFLLETDCGLGLALDTLFDLEALYLFWMQGLGSELWAFEDVHQPERRRMAWRIFRDRFDPAYGLVLGPDRPAEYDPTQATEVQFVSHTGWQLGSSNLVHTYLPLSAERPERLFELAVAQLLTSTLLLGHPGSADPPEPGQAGPVPRYPATPMWAEIGLSAYLGRQFDGPPGFAAYAPLLAPLTREEIQQALTPVAPIAGSPLSLARAEITNLCGLPYGYFQPSADGIGDRLSSQSAWHRAKASAWGAFLLGQSPLPERAERGGRAALIEYLRQALREGRGHSSAALDGAFGGPRGQVRIEELEPRLFEWLASL
jgi:hypothetical protein